MAAHLVRRSEEIGASQSAARLDDRASEGKVQQVSFRFEASRFPPGPQIPTRGLLRLLRVERWGLAQAPCVTTWRSHARPLEKMNIRRDNPRAQSAAIVNFDWKGDSEFKARLAANRLLVKQDIDIVTSERMVGEDQCRRDGPKCVDAVHHDHRAGRIERIGETTKVSVVADYSLL